MTDSLDGLIPIARKAAQAALDELGKVGVRHKVTSTFRTFLEQHALWMQGRFPLEEVNAARAVAGMARISPAENLYTVTNCDGIPASEGKGHSRSPHQLSIALDVVPLEGDRPVWPPATDPRWEVIAAAFRKRGFECGLDWKDFTDPPHHQYKG